VEDQGRQPFCGKITSAHELLMDHACQLELVSLSNLKHFLVTDTKKHAEKIYIIYHRAGIPVSARKICYAMS
jgi:hypothetical protein